MARVDLLNTLNDDQFPLLEPLRYDDISSLFGTCCDASLLDLFCIVDHHDVMASLVEQHGRLRHHKRLMWCTTFHNYAHDTARNKLHLVQAIVQRVVTAVLKESAWLSNESNRGAAYEIWGRSGLGPRAWKGDWDPFVLSERASPLDSVERPLVSGALARARGVRGAAADALGIDRGTLARRLRALGLDRP